MSVPRSDNELVPVFRRSAEDLAAICRSVDLSGAGSLATLLGRLDNGGDGEEFLPCVSAAVSILLEQDGGCDSPTEAATGATFDLEGLLASIQRWALDAIADECGSGRFPKAVQVWAPGGGDQHVAYTAAQCRGLLANALLLNVQDPTAAVSVKRNQGGLDFAVMVRSTRPVSAHKLACLLRYFDTARQLEGTEDDAREVVFERRSGAANEEGLRAFQEWAMQAGADKHIDGSEVLLHSGGMEGIEEADAFVNFANPNFGYGCFIPSCTQEEIIQMCCPEFNVGMVQIGYMLDHEVVNVHGVRRFSKYTGYLDRFRYAGAWTATPSVQTIVTLDATTRSHWSSWMVLRDIRKAYLGFDGCKVVSTGRWGCGVFGGTPAHKFAQQLVAASLAGCSLRFSTFGDMDECDTILETVMAARPSAATLLQAVLTASAAAEAQRGKHFSQSLAAILQDEQELLHHAETVASGQKYILRGDVMHQREPQVRSGDSDDDLLFGDDAFDELAVLGGASAPDSDSDFGQ